MHLLLSLLSLLIMAHCNLPSELVSFSSKSLTYENEKVTSRNENASAILTHFIYRVSLVLELRLFLILGYCF